MIIEKSVIWKGHDFLWYIMSYLSNSLEVCPCSRSLAIPTAEQSGVWREESTGRREGGEERAGEWENKAALSTADSETSMTAVKATLVESQLQTDPGWQRQKFQEETEYARFLLEDAISTISSVDKSIYEILSGLPARCILREVHISKLRERLDKFSPKLPPMCPEVFCSLWTEAKNEQVSVSPSSRAWTVAWQAKVPGKMVHSLRATSLFPAQTHRKIPVHSLCGNGIKPGMRSGSEWCRPIVSV